jgi:hypothetical protein
MFEFFKNNKKKQPTFIQNENNNENIRTKLIISKKFPFLKKQKVTNAQISWFVYLEQQKNKELKEEEQYHINEIRRINGLITNNKIKNVKKNKIIPL